MRYTKRLTTKELLALLSTGKYRIDVETGEFYGRRLIKPFTDRRGGRLFVRLYSGGKRRAISLHRLVWMVVTRQAIPWRFEVHHRDGDVTNNAWSNLLCVHEMDHRKLHGKDEEIPL